MHTLYTKIGLSILLVLYTGLIFKLGMTPADEISGSAEAVSDMSKHTVGLFALVVLASVWARSVQLIRFLTIGFFYAITIGFLVEVAQMYIPGRAFEVQDIVTNTVGVLLGTLTLFVLDKLTCN